jgi:hypothetical protein
MLYRVIDLGYWKLKSGIDDEALKRLLHGHEVVSSTEHLYHHDGLPHLLVSVHYRLATLTHSHGPVQRESSRQGTPRQGRASSHDPASAGPVILAAR